MIVRSKVVNGQSWFKLGGRWTKDVTEEQKFDYHKRHPKILWLDEPRVLPIERLLKRRKNQYLVEFKAEDEPYVWLHKRDISQDAIDEYRNRTKLKLSYNLKHANKIYDDREKPDKSMANYLFAESSRHVNGRIVYLEARKMQTTRALLKHPQCKVPINFDHDLYLHFLDRNYPNVSPKYGTLNEYLATTPDPIGSLFADYCCTFMGSKQCQPQDDLRVLFERKLLSANGCLALTFCLRDGRKIFQTHAQQKQVIIAFVLSLASKYGYALQLDVQRTYQRSMFFLLFTSQ